jgi:hypothetical protein
MMVQSSSDIGCCQEGVTPRSEPKQLDRDLTDENQERAAVAQHEAGFPA